MPPRASTRETTNVSIVATSEYKLRLKLLALALGKREGDLVREALDKCFGEKLESISLVTSVSQKIQTVL